ncbi:MAG TPA: ArsA-related P-loop ATPase [Candidatus Binataceae bacterium]|nr:ArsA-related P-loop ATPase [Candidatus Binataceae bacterium]
MKPPIETLLSKRLLICVGPGGVGKTTISAALALAAAASGRAVDVMTIDPAPRLLDALGLDPDSNQPQTVSLRAIGSAKRGRLRAMRLDAKHTFDRLVDRYAPSASARDAILENRIYRNLSQALAGITDYMAVERLLELHENDGAELIVLDTPPAAEAMDFLDAPRRLLDFLNSRAVTLLGAPGGLLRGGLSIVDLAARAVLSAFDRVTGLHLLRDVQGFIRGFEGMYPGFAERAGRAQALLRDPACSAVIVITAERERVAQVRSFVEGLEAAGVALGAVLVNRVTGSLPRIAASAERGIDPALARKLERNLADFRALKRREAGALDAIRALIPAHVPLIVAPDLGREPRNLRDLAEIGRRLAAAG